MIRRLMALIAVAAAAVTGCTDSGEGETGASPETVLRVVVPDGIIRPEGAECSGGRPYRHVREGAPFTVETGDGTVLAGGDLPVGEAVNADPSIDWEDLERIPTVCIMELAVGDLGDHPEYGLRIADDDPLLFSAADVAAGTPIVLIVGG